MCMPAPSMVDLQPLFFNLTLDTATSLLFGRSVYSLRAGVDQAAENNDFAQASTLYKRAWPNAFAWHPSTFSTALELSVKLVATSIDSSSSISGNAVLFRAKQSPQRVKALPILGSSIRLLQSRSRRRKFGINCSISFSLGGTLRHVVYHGLCEYTSIGPRMMLGV